jgi:hypothetical protein
LYYALQTAAIGCLISFQGEGVVLFDSAAEHPPDRIRRYIITTLVFVGLMFGASWYLMRFHTEKRTARHFMDTVVAGKMEEAYKLWKPSPSYSYKDFLDDWGPQGYYGPVKSYRIEDTQHVKNGSGLVVVLDVSPYSPYPERDDAIKQAKTQEARLWVEFSDQSLSFPP